VSAFRLNCSVQQLLQFAANSALSAYL